MADPLSIVASVASLVALGTSVVSSGYSYLSAARSAPKEIAQLLNQTSALNLVLSQLMPLSANQASSPRRNALTALDHRGALDECHSTLNSISSLLSQFQQLQGHTKGNVVKALKWPFKEGKADRIVMKLDRLQNLFQFAIAVDNDSSLQRLEEQLEQIDGFQTLSITTRSVLEHTKDVQEDVRTLKQLINDSNYKNILTWLSVLDPSAKHRATVSLHQPGTGTWIFDERMFQNWLQQGPPGLWLCAPVGFGKTVLASTIINRMSQGLLSTRNALAFHYCDFRDENSLGSTNILGSLVRQIVSQSPKVPSAVQILYENLVNIRAPTVDDFEDLLIQISGSPFEFVYLVIDGLDESPKRERILQAITKLCQPSMGAFLRIMVISRPSHDIRQSFEEADVPIFRVGADQISRDVENHVEAEPQKQPKLLKLPEEMKQSVRLSITGGAQGMFRWVKCQLDVLCKARSTAAIRRALSELPTGLDETYDRILVQVQHDDRVLVRRALQWLIGCMRPMTLTELAEAVIIDPENDVFDPDERLIDPNELLEMCGSLVNLAQENKIVSLAHYSVKEYLLSPRLAAKQLSASFFAVSEPDCSSLTTTSLLVYIFHLGTVIYGSTDPVSGGEIAEADYPLFDYTRYLWRNHCSYGNSKSAQEWFRCFFEEVTDSQPANWIAMVNQKESWTTLRFINPSPSTFIQNATEFLLLSFIEKEMQQNSQASPGECSSTLDQAIVMLGLCAEPTPETDLVLWTHLTAASQCGFKSVVEYLLGVGFSQPESSRFNHFSAPLSLAAKVGYKGIVRLLLQSKWNTSLFHDDHGMALILAAARRGPRGREIVEFLLDSGVDTNAPDIYGFTIHHWVRHDTAIRRTLSPFLSRLDKLRTHDPEYQNLSIRRRSILQLIWSIKAAGSLMHAAECGWLSACLRFEGLDEEAAIFAEQRIIPGDSIEHWWTGCDMHNAAIERSLVGTRYRCLSCFDTDLCSDCHRIWEAGEALDFCKGHVYVAIPRESWYRLPTGNVNTKGQGIGEILDELEARFAENESR